MTENPGILFTLLAFALTIGLLVFVHEMGHYLVGRWCGVKADRFSIGFGREVVGWTDRQGTRWKLGWLPLGGYVQFAGDMDPAGATSAEWQALPEKEKSKTFQSKSLAQRAAIVVAGPAINFLFAVLILTGFVIAYGKDYTPASVVRLLDDSAAVEMGLRPGDRIVSFNGEQIETFQQLQQEVAIRPKERVTLTIERDGKQRQVSGVTDERIERDRFGNEYRLGMLGVRSPPRERRDVSLIEAPVEGVRVTAAITSSMITTIGQLITGRRSVDELGGPLKIAQVSGQQMDTGPTSYLFFVAMLSINLGFINLLPIPMLDGGHLLMYAIEAVRRRPASPNVQEWVFRAGFAVLVTFMLFVTVNDLKSFGLFG